MLQNHGKENTLFWFFIIYRLISPFLDTYLPETGSRIEAKELQDYGIKKFRHLILP
jgi:hypothetical protein